MVAIGPRDVGTARLRVCAQVIPDRLGLTAKKVALLSEVSRPLSKGSGKKWHYLVSTDIPPDVKSRAPSPSRHALS